jgi:predicted RNA-binding Zn-ribbon protein involved in translation (DUF1610 family)
MNDRTWSAPRIRRIQFARGGAGSSNKVEWIVAGVLAVIIVLALVLTLWPETVEPNPHNQLHYMCPETGEQFVQEKTEEHYRKMEQAQEEGWYVAEVGPIVPLPCPESGNMALPAFVCPNCGTWYVPESVKRTMELKEEGYPPMSPAHLEVMNIQPKCPNCGMLYVTAMDKYMQEKYHNE